MIGEMSHQDQEQALRRKEAIWNRTRAPIKSRRWIAWLLLLLALLGLSAVAYKVLSDANKQSHEARPLLATSRPASMDNPETLSILADVQGQLKAQRLLVDSLARLSMQLTDQVSTLTADRDRLMASATAASTVQLVKDTIYITDVQVEPQFVPQMVRDTIYLVDTVVLEGVPTDDLYEPLAEVPEDLLEQSEKSDDSKSDRPTSVQFYFNGSKPDTK